MNIVNSDYHAYNQNNQGINGSDNDQIFLLISIGSWIQVLITGLLCFTVPDLDIYGIDILVASN